MRFQYHVYIAGQCLMSDHFSKESDAMDKALVVLRDISLGYVVAPYAGSHVSLFLNSGRLETIDADGNMVPFVR